MSLVLHDVRQFRAKSRAQFHERPGRYSSSPLKADSSSKYEYWPNPDSLAYSGRWCWRRRDPRAFAFNEQYGRRSDAKT